MTSIEHQRHACDVIVQARAEYDRHRSRIAMVAFFALIGAIFIIGAALAGTQ